MRRWLVLLLVISALVLPGAPAAAAQPHWAAADVDTLATALGWTAPVDLDVPIPVLEWNRLVARWAGELPGDADPAVSPRQNWVWMYSGGMARGTFVIRREDAIGGLMKLVSMLHKEAGFTAAPATLSAFGDGAKVADYQQVLVAGAVKLGVVAGYPGGELHPSQPLTYAEGAKLIARLVARYGAAKPAQAPVPAAEWPQPRGFAANMGLHLPNERVIHAGWPVGTVGTAWWVLNGAAYAWSLPGAGNAPAGHVWVVADAEIYNWDLPELTIAPDALRFTLGDYQVDQQASAAMGWPFGQATVVLKQRESLRGLVVFAVPEGAQGLWIQCDSKLGLATGKPGWNGSARIPLGNLPRLTK